MEIKGDIPLKENDENANNITEKIIEEKVNDFKQRMEKIERNAEKKNENLEENIHDVIQKKIEHVGYIAKAAENNIPSEPSKIEDLSCSKAVKIMNNDSLADYTNEYRTNPGESFYNQNIEDINKMDHDKHQEKTLEMTRETQEPGVFQIHMKRASVKQVERVASPNNNHPLGDL